MDKFRVEGLDLYYGSFQALKNINLTIREHEITAMIGPSGCGKSTLLKTLNRMNDLVEGCRVEGNVTLDGEDIYALANGLDDGVDNLQGTLQRIVMYRTGKAMSGAVTLTKLLIESTEEIIRAFSLLKNIRKNQAQILEATHKIGRLESEGDRVYRHEVAYLFDKEKDPIELIKWKDILENLENTLDHCEKIADMLRGVVMKYA